jgi:hypothetical protein
MSFHIGSGLYEEPSLDGLAEGVPVPIRIINRPPLTVSSPLLRLALYRLWQWGRRWPIFDELAAEVGTELASRNLEPALVADPALLRARLAGQLLRAFFAEAVRFSTRTPPIARTVPPYPATGRYQRHLASIGNPALVNLGHEAFDATAHARTLLPLMDGTRSLTELHAATSLERDEFLEQLELLRHTGFILDPDLAAPFV